MTDRQLTLDIAISTYGPAGIERVEKMNLPKMEGVSYVVSWQLHGDAPVPSPLEEREDVAVFRYDKAGQSNNRNNAIDHCTADLVMIGDDDLTYIEDGLREAVKIFEEQPDLDFAAFHCVHPSERFYPSEMTPLGLPLPKGYSIGGVEICFRREPVEKAGIRFHPLLGLNSPAMHSGEDEFFLICAIRNGLDCRYFPVDTCIHPHESTGTKARFTPANVRGMGCIIALTYPFSWAPRVILKAWRMRKARKFSFFQGLWCLMQGVAKAPAVSKGQW